MADRVLAVLLILTCTALVGCEEAIPGVTCNPAPGWHADFRGCPPLPDVEHETSASSVEESA